MNGENNKDISNEKRTILIVEDNELNQEILTDILDDKYNILIANNGAEGIQVLRKNVSSIMDIYINAVRIFYTWKKQDKSV